MKKKLCVRLLLPLSLILIVALTGTLQLKGQSLVEFDASSLVGSPVPTELPVFTVAPHLNSTAITRNNVNPVGTGSAFTSNGWAIGPTAPAGGKYLTFTLSASPGYVLDLSGATIRFDCRRSGSGPNAVYIYSSVGGFASSANALTTVTPIVSSGATPLVYTFPTGAAYDNQFNVEIRIYADQASSAGGQLRILDPSSGGNVRITGGVVKPYGMSSLPCGVTYTKKSTIVNAANVAGATSYRFRFYNSTTGALISQYSQASRMLSLASVPAIYYNNTYKWTVAADIGYGYGPESNNNCTMTLAPVQTTIPCGAYYTRLNSYTTVPNPMGVTNYRFTIYDNTTGAIVAQRVQNSTYLYFNTLSGLYYGTTYRWTVACEYTLATGGSAWGPESNSSCTLTFGAAQTTVPCGVSFTNLGAYTTVLSPGNVVNYRFTFYDVSTGAIVAQRTQASTYIYFNTVTGLAYGNSYNWTVACEYPLAAGGTAWGPESSAGCTITFAAPVTTVPCGNTYNYSTGYTTASPVTNIMGYRFRFYQNSVMVAESAQSSNYIHFAQVPGLSVNQTYTWTVEVKYNSPSGPAYGPASDAQCTVTLGSSARLASEEPGSDLQNGTAPGVNTDNSIEQITVYPNPATEKTTIVSSEPVVASYIYSVTGELLQTNGSGNELNVSDLAPGTYFVLVQTESGMKRSTFIKE